MPGPGGGGHSGGGGRGGFSGGGFSGGGHVGGGFGPTMHRGPVMGGGYGRRYGGCCSGCMSWVIIGIFILFALLYALFPSIRAENQAASPDDEIWGSDSAVVYDETAIQDYANSQYEWEFDFSSAYEDNLLITVLVEEEEYYSYYYIAWVGDHIDSEINNLFGNDDTTLGKAMSSCISSTNYKYSLDSDLAKVIETMTRKIQNLGLADSFTCSEEHAQIESHLTNYTRLEMTEDTVNEALKAFTEATGIPIVIVVEYMDEVF